MHKRLEKKRVELRAIEAAIQADAVAGRCSVWTPEAEIRSRDHLQLQSEVATLETSIESVGAQVERLCQHNKAIFLGAGITITKK